MKWRKHAWDLVAIAAVIGMAYGVWQIVEVKGWWLGLLLGGVSVLAGYLAFEMIYPFWFGGRR